MKYLILLAFLSTGCGPAAFQQAPSPERYLIAGQSNSVSPGNGASPAYSKTGKVSINDPYHPEKSIRVPTATDPNETGYTWIALGDLMDRSVTFNIVGQGGSTTTQWHDSFYQKIVDALSKDRYTAVIWVQGESDSPYGANLSPEESFENLLFVINKSREIQPGITWYVALDGFYGSKPARAAQQRLIDAGIVLQGGDLDLIRTEHPDYFEPSQAELVAPGFASFAQQWNQIIKAPN